MFTKPRATTPPTSNNAINTSIIRSSPEPTPEELPCEKTER